MKKKKNIGLIIGSMLVVLAIVAGGTGYFIYNKQQKKFVGEWKLRGSDLIDQRLVINEKNEVTVSMRTAIEDLSEDKFSYTYSDTKVKGNKMSVSNHEISRYESYFAIEKGSALESSFPEFARNIVKEELAGLSDEEIDQFVTMGDNSLTIKVDDPKAIKKMTGEKTDNETDQEDRSFTLEISNDGKRLKWGKNLYVRETATKQKKRVKETTTTSSASSTSISSSEDVSIVKTVDSSKTEKPWVYEPNQFAYYFLILDDKESRKTFIDEQVAESAKKMFQEHLQDKPVYPNAELDDVYADERLYTESDQEYYAQLVSVDEKVEYILKKDVDGKIIDVLGPGWTKAEAEYIKKMETYIRVRPTMTLRYFVVYYLIEPDKNERKETITENEEYATESCRDMLLAHVDDDFDDFERGTWYHSKFSDGSVALIINDSEDRSVYLMKLNDDSQLTNVYGGSFETLAEAEYDYVMANKGELITVF